MGIGGSMNIENGSKPKKQEESSAWEVFGDFLQSLLEVLGDILENIDFSDIDFGGD